MTSRRVIANVAHECDLWGPFAWLGALAQLGERLLCKHQVIGSIPIGSTTANDIVVSTASAA
jgi:hypothetical protein